MKPSPETQGLRESLSALADGECSEFELRRLLAAAEAGRLRADWHALSVTRAALQAETAAWSTCDISLQVQAAIAGEHWQASPWQRLWKPLAGSAVAAAVAGLVVLGASYFPAGDAPQVNAPLAAAGSPAIGAAPFTHTVSTGPQAAASSRSHDAVARVSSDRFGDYVQRHAESTALGEARGLLPMARVAAFQAEAR